MASAHSPPCLRRGAAPLHHARRHRRPSARASASARKAVALHGKGGGGALFRADAGVKGIVDELGGDVEWQFPDGTTELKQGARAWWDTPDGTRSFENDVWVGAEDALDAAAAAAEGADVLLGFSQGAMLIGALLAEKRVPESVRACVLVGAAWPRPFASGLSDLVKQRLGPKAATYKSPALLHVVSPNDTINPPASAHMLQATLGGDILYHESGHSVPVEKSAEVAAWVRDALASE